MYSTGTWASLRAHSGKNGISVPSATLATKNRNEPTRAAGGAVRKAMNEAVRNLKMRLTSWLHAPRRLRPHHAGKDRPGALADVNAYGAEIAARRERLDHGAGGGNTKSFER